MSSHDVLDLDCGIAHQRLESWLKDELQLQNDGDGWLYPTSRGNCLIRLMPLGDRQLGAVAIERCRLLASGPVEALAIFNAAFTLRFVSAGG